MQRKNFYLSLDLAERTERLAKEIGSNLSELVRHALEEYIERVEREMIEREIRGACEFYYNEDKKLADAWYAAEPGIE
jgi:metal-responsive CopG/Arc/MetJ family transcriptional regulator